MRDATASVLAEVSEERRRQDQKWGEQNHTLANWLAILGEEFGEVCRAVDGLLFRGATAANYREELIHTAAVCVNMIECLDRHTRG